MLNWSKQLSVSIGTLNICNIMFIVDSNKPREFCICITVFKSLNWKHQIFNYVTMLHTSICNEANCYVI